MLHLQTCLYASIDEVLKWSELRSWHSAYPHKHIFRTPTGAQCSTKTGGRVTCEYKRNQPASTDLLLDERLV